MRKAIWTWPLQAPTFVSGPVLLGATQKTVGASSVTALAGDLNQPVSFKAQVLVHPAVGPVGPFLDLKLFPSIGAALVAKQVAGDGLSAFLQHFAGPVPDADQLTAAAQGIGRRSLTG